MRDGVFSRRATVPAGETFEVDFENDVGVGYLRRFVMPREVAEVFPRGTMSVAGREPFELAVSWTVADEVARVPQVDLDACASYADLKISPGDVVHISMPNRSGREVTFVGALFFRRPTPEAERQNVEWAVRESAPAVVEPGKKATFRVECDLAFKAEVVHMLNADKFNISSLKIGRSEQLAVSGTPAEILQELSTNPYGNLTLYFETSPPKNVIEVVVENVSDAPVRTVVKFEGVEYSGPPSRIPESIQNAIKEIAEGVRKKGADE